MGRRTRRVQGTGRAIGMAVAMLAGVATIALTPDVAGACSFAPPTLEIVGQPAAGGTLHVHGNGYFAIDGYLDGMCGGTYSYVPQPGVTLVVDYQTLSGPRSVALIAHVSGGRLPQGSTAAFETFQINEGIPIPADATSVHVEARHYGTASQDDATITGASATTVPAPTPSPDPTAPPATPVDGQPTFTG